MTKIKFALLVLNTLWLLAVSQAGHARHAAIIIDADNGNVLHEVEATQSWYPASLTKLMTIYMTFDAIREGRVGLHDSMVTSAHASQQPNSKLGLRRGERISVEDAILAIITRSANDASVVLAEHIGGTEENFAANMTAKAHALGMYNTHFMNATGLPNNWQVSTPRDLAVLAWKTLHNYPEFYHYFGAHSFNFKGSQLRGINKFTANYPGAEGMKTGFTCGSGFNLIGSAQQNGKRLIGVVMGGMTSKERYDLMMQKMDYSFARLDSADPSRNIATMQTSGAGSPPYQLDCGNGGSGVVRSIPVSHHVNYAPRHHRAAPVHAALHHPQKTHARPQTSIQAKAIAKAFNKSKPQARLVQTKAKSVAKQPAKSQNYHKPSAIVKTKAASHKASAH